MEKIRGKGRIVTDGGVGGGGGGGDCIKEVK